MKNCFYLIYILMIIITFIIASESCAKASWWDTGVNTLRKLNSPTSESINKKPSSLEISKAFKQALRMATDQVVKKLGAVNGFYGDPAIHIPLPKELSRVRTVLSKLGKSQLLDELELKLNRAAELAAPKAKDIFFKAISEMTFDDVKKIYKGPDDSATKYFETKMTPELKEKMRPIIQNVLSQAGVVQAYDSVIGEYKKFPFVPDVKANLEEYVLQKGIKGIFHYMAIEEANIRKNPAKQTTELLKRVFGAK